MGNTLNNLVEDSLVIMPVRNATGPNALTYNPATGKITYSTLGEATKENIQVYERDVEAILQGLVVKELNYTNKNKYTQPRPETLKLPILFEEWVEANHPPKPEILEGKGLYDGGDGPVGCDGMGLEELYAEYVERQSIVRYEVVNKEETHVGLIAEDVQAIALELVYDDPE
ncbi:hypothetical protein SARC_05686 [Sphaeroforma arctica JP610]|uniref:Peptidase S74 domain-containing protein n=1 Tax=Sphaeroforma arctica JP610 TaxID=667725 RepID=A0A0L0FZN2_9EUKA|nr:hypothetical protein SARC_05686 [Sphaeroforma arctica JP610]KNC82026.1 hypothetical protein SARC_05686 [Sphaeroforma arctica JP610]|eukprot:XP_014155928.1 hypothetical protein SARC_05686 [Sphaeroforma arctica JP610]